MTSAMPAAPNRLPVRAVFGEARNLSARMKVAAAINQTAKVMISLALTTGPRAGA